MRSLSAANARPVKVNASASTKTTSRVLKKGASWFESLRINGIFSITSDLFPFVLSSSKDSQRVFHQPASSLKNPVWKMLKKLSFPDRFEPLELLERFELSNRTSWNRELLENVYGFLWRSKNRRGDISGFVSWHQARRRPLTFLPFAQECQVLFHRLERLP